MLEQLQSCIYCSINPAFALSVPPSDFKVDAFSSEANCAQSCIVRVATAASDFSPADGMMEKSAGVRSSSNLRPVRTTVCRQVSAL